MERVFLVSAITNSIFRGGAEVFIKRTPLSESSARRILSRKVACCLPDNMRRLIGQLLGLEIAESHELLCEIRPRVGDLVVVVDFDDFMGMLTVGFRGGSPNLEHVFVLYEQLPPAE